MSIRKSIRQNQILILITVVVLLSSLFISIKYIRAMAESERELLTLSNSVNSMLLLEHQLLLDKDVSAIVQSGNIFSQAKNSIQKINDRLLTLGIKDIEVNTLLKHVINMENAFISLTELQMAIGLTEDEGVRAKFRNAAHSLQNQFTALDNQSWQIAILEIRRKEKDFLLRGDRKLIEEQSHLIKELFSEIDDSNYGQGTTTHLKRLLQSYQSQINVLVDNLHHQGITSNNGLRHVLSIEESLIKQNVSNLTSRVSEIIQLKINQVLGVAALITGIILIMSFVRLMRVNTRIYQKLKSMSRTMTSITQSNDLTIRFSETGNDEFSQLSKELNELLQHFQVVLDKLSDAKIRMLRSERMVSLIEMVGGVAHELNTPLGNALTCESIIKENITALKTSFENGKLKKTEFKNIINTCEDAIDLLESNLYKTDGLIEQFKEVSTFQNYEETVTFNLKETVKPVITSLHYEIKNIPCKVHLDIPDNCILKSYSGVIAQIVQISVVNCIRHASVIGRTLNITVSAELQKGKELTLMIKDDGKGIPESDIKRVFEPFFTTKRNQGGTGLGLSVIYNLVTQKLEGNVYINSNENEGVLVTVKLPITP